MKVARFRFDAGLLPLLQRANDGGEFDYAFSGPQSAKHLIESVGIPHTEIGGIHARLEPVDPGYLVRDGDTIEVFAYDANPDTPIEPCFVLDGHLGRLNAYMRMLGSDCFYQNDYDDSALLRISLTEDRILLTRDRRLLMHKALRRGYLVRSPEPQHQLGEVVRHYGLQRWIRPFQRCLRCNHLLQPVEKESVLDRLEPRTKLYFDEFHICPACKQIYWKGSHFDKMVKILSSLGE
jgi:uncharacterized protein